MLLVIQHERSECWITRSGRPRQAWLWWFAVAIHRDDPSSRMTIFGPEELFRYWAAVDFPFISSRTVAWNFSVFKSTSPNLKRLNQSP